VNRSLRVVVAGAAGLVVFVLAWEALVRLLDVPPFILRAPSQIASALAENPSTYVEAALVTARHTIVGITISLLAAVVVGGVLAASRLLEEAAQPVLVLILVTPWVAYFTSIVIWLDGGDASAYFLVAFVTFPGFTFAMVAGFRSADANARELFTSVDAGRWEVLWRLRLPSALPTLFAAARFNIGLGLAAAYFAEGGNLTNDGLGAIGVRAINFNDGDVLWSAIVTTALLGVALLMLLTVVERLVLSWHVSQRSA
jgi:NitT/TauT family transport system permease protein